MKCSYCEARAIGFERVSAERINVCAGCAHVDARVHRFDGTSYLNLSEQRLRHKRVQLRRKKE